MTLRRLEGRFSGRAPGLILALAVVAGGFTLGLAYAHDASRQLDTIGRLGGLEVRAITLKGQQETSDSALVASMALAPGATMLGVDVEEARERIEALPWVRAATVRKVLPGSISVTIEEAEAFARWRHEGTTHIVAEDGTVLADEVAPVHANLPLVAGKGADRRAGEAVALIARHPDIAPIVTAAILINERRWDLLLLSGARVRLEEGDPDAAILRLARLQAAGVLHHAGQAVIDLRLADRTTVQLAPHHAPTPETLPADAQDPLAAMIAEGQRYDDPLARAIAEAAL